MSERFVIVHRTYDSIQAGFLGDLLRDAGLTARVTGTRFGAGIGVAQNILEVHIAVPESEAGQATDFLEAYFSAETVDEVADGEVATSGAAADPGSVYASPGETTPAERELRPLLAAGTAFLTFGVGHLYARRPGTAAALLVGQLVAMAFLFTGDGWYEWTVGLTALLAIIACDVIGSMIATCAYRSGIRRGAAWQAAVGAMYVGGSLLFAHAVGPHLANPRLGDPTGGFRRVQPTDPMEKLERPLQRDPSFPPLVTEHPANPSRH